MQCESRVRTKTGGVEVVPDDVANAVSSDPTTDHAPRTSLTRGFDGF